MPNLLVIDNYDSFTYNLVQMFMGYPLRITVVRSDQLCLDDVPAHQPDYILISPGPKDPQHAGISKEVIRSFYKTIPILGVCLGMQSINEVFGGTTVRAPIPMHGKVSEIFHRNKSLFRDLPSPFTAARYHSLIIRRNPSGEDKDELVETAHTKDGIIMGLSHSRYPLHGVQFHPESFLTPGGSTIIQQFLKEGVLRSVLGRKAIQFSEAEEDKSTPQRLITIHGNTNPLKKRNHSVTDE